MVDDSKQMEVQIRFVTKLSIEIPDNQFGVPDKLARYGLSEIINHLLGQQDRDSVRPYDFLIEGEFLRTDLKKYLLGKKLSGEAGLTLEVVEALPAPDSDVGSPHPDWISCISSIKDRFVVTACYDGVVRVFAQGADQPLSLQSDNAVVVRAHANAVTSVALFDGPDDMFVTGSKDRTAKVWQMVGGVARCRAVCSGHRESLETVATLGSRFCTAGWDKTVMVWDLDAVLAGGEAGEASKRRKTDAGPEDAGGPVETEAPMAVFEGHSQNVSALAWPHPNAVYSGSWDMSIRMWDTSTGTNANTWHGNKAVSGMSFSLLGNLLATAHHDKSVRIWDPRMKDGEVVKLTLRSHKSWVTDVEFSPEMSHTLASTSHDGTVKLWDIRAKVPLHTLRPHTDKVMCVDWYDSANLLSGGADCLLRTHAVRK